MSGRRSGCTRSSLTERGSQVGPGDCAFRVGACIGSFLNVVITGCARGRIVSPGSRCPLLRKGDPPLGELPIQGYLWAAGANAPGAGACISWRYPLVEALTAFG
jgi:prepilin signal peptidase PulO-like enzyme (type II secretory pathway)